MQTEPHWPGLQRGGGNPSREICWDLRLLSQGRFSFAGVGRKNRKKEGGEGG